MNTVHVQQRYCTLQQTLLITHQDPPSPSLPGDELPGPVLGLGHEVSLRPRPVVIRVTLVLIRLPPHYWLTVLLPRLAWSKLIVLQF